MATSVRLPSCLSTSYASVWAPLPLTCTVQIPALAGRFAGALPGWSVIALPFAVARCTVVCRTPARYRCTSPGLASPTNTGAEPSVGVMRIRLVPSSPNSSVPGFELSLTSAYPSVLNGPLAPRST